MASLCFFLFFFKKNLSLGILVGTNGEVGNRDRRKKKPSTMGIKDRDKEDLGWWGQGEKRILGNMRYRRLGWKRDIVMCISRLYKEIIHCFATLYLECH